jgi:hypothetical protein
LGPTSDDLTAEAVAQAFALPLEFDTVAYAQIEQFFNMRHRAMPASNRKQALLPQGAQRLDNAQGTAPGFSLQHGRCWFVFMPGVPSEMRHLFLDRILPTVGNRFPLRPNTLITLKTIGIGESAIQERISAIAIPAPVQLGFRASLNEVQTKLLFPPDYPVSAMTALVNAFAEQLGDAVFAIDGLGTTSDSLITVIDDLMTANQTTLAVVETASCGLLASLCIGSDWLLSASYQHAGAAITAELTTDYLTDTAKTIVADLQQNSDADIILVQLYTGNNRTLHDHNKPIVVHTALIIGTEIQWATHSIVGTLIRKQHQAAWLSLDVLRRYLQNKGAANSTAT